MDGAVHFYGLEGSSSFGNIDFVPTKSASHESYPAQDGGNF